ncbi:MAG: hypothetical protein KBE23_06395 [Chloroflexi bacterium]|nr:hypothetical protein [Chloroflexota bacterium]
MTKPREWPNAMRLYRDRAAEETNDAARSLDRLIYRVERGEFTRAGLERDLLDVSRRLHVALRHLEAAGAETEPE